MRKLGLQSRCLRDPQQGQVTHKARQSKFWRLRCLRINNSFHSIIIFHFDHHSKYHETNTASLLLQTVYTSKNRHSTLQQKWKMQCKVKKQKVAKERQKRTLKILRLEGITRLLSWPMGPLGGFAGIRILHWKLSRHPFACWNIYTMNEKVINEEQETNVY